MDYTIDTFMKARECLRAELQMAEEKFSKEKMLGMLSDEIKTAISRGMTHEEIAQIMKNMANISIDAYDIKIAVSSSSKRNEGESDEN